MRPAITLILVSLALVLIAALTYACASDQKESTSWEWSNGISGQVLELMSDGTYSTYSICDICPRRKSYGHWHLSGDTYTFTPTDKNMPKLKRVTALGCDFLIRQRITPPPPDAFPLGITQLDFAPYQSDCHERVLQHALQHRVAP